MPQGNTSEDDIWAVLHAENIRRGGEWIETRLLASGRAPIRGFRNVARALSRTTRSSPFDTDLIGSYGICIDISRTWWIGDRSAAARYGLRHAARPRAHHDQHGDAETRRDDPRTRRQLPRLDEQFQAQKYGCLMHGVGLCDEWPLVAYPDQAVPGAFDYALEAGMVLCVEAAVGAEGGDFSIKLEDQVLITEDGYENLTTYPFDARLMGR